MESCAVAGHKSGSVGETSYSYGRLLSRPTTKRRSGIVWEASLFVRTAPEPSDDEPQVSFLFVRLLNGLPQAGRKSDRV